MTLKVPVIEVSSQYQKHLGRSRPQKVSCAQVSPHQCRSELASPSLDSGRAANMKPNEPKSSAAAACPASARNTREGEREGE